MGSEKWSPYRVLDLKICNSSQEYCFVAQCCPRTSGVNVEGKSWNRGCETPLMFPVPL